MTWQATVYIHNHTTDTITVTHSVQGDIGTVAPEGSWTWSTDQQSQSLAVRLDSAPGVTRTQGSLSFAPETGVYMDRGNLTDDQDLTLGADVNGTQYLQTRDGGMIVSPWSHVSGGAEIHMNWFNDA